MDKKTNKLQKILILILILIIIIFFFSVKLVNVGRVGIVLEYRKITEKTLEEGWHIINPFKIKIIEINKRTEKTEIETVVSTKDLQYANIRLAINHQLVIKEAGKLYNQVGLSYEDKIIVPEFIEIIKTIIAKYTAEDLIVKRDIITNEVQDYFKNSQFSSYFIIQSISLVNVDFSEAFDKAIEEKQVAQQEALKALNILEKTKTEAMQQIEKAKAEAETIKIQSEAIKENGGKEYVQLKFIEKWNGQLPTTMLEDNFNFIKQINN